MGFSFEDSCHAFITSYCCGVDQLGCIEWRYMAEEGLIVLYSFWRRVILAVVDIKSY